MSKKNIFFALIFTIFLSHPFSLKIVSSIFPLYDWIEELTLGTQEKIFHDTLLKGNADFHSYSPSANDVVKILSADFFVFTGGESDSWVAEILKDQKQVHALNLIDFFKNSENQKIQDEHIWLSIKNAKKICQKICQELCELDPKNAGVYKKNCDAYEQKLSALDLEYEKFAATQKKSLIIADRFPFFFLFDDYGIKYFSAFSGCSSETNSSFKVILDLAQKIDSENSKIVYIIEESDDSFAKAVIKSTKNKNAKIFSLDSMQTSPKNPLKTRKLGENFLTVMQNNLLVLKESQN